MSWLYVNLTMTKMSKHLKCLFHYIYIFHLLTHSLSVTAFVVVEKVLLNCYYTECMYK